MTKILSSLNYSYQSIKTKILIYRPCDILAFFLINIKREKEFLVFDLISN